MWLLSYFWNSEIHLEIFSLSFESAAAGVELVLAVWIARTVIAFEKAPNKKIEQRREKLEAAFGLIAALFLAVAVGSVWRLVVLHDANEKKFAQPFLDLSNQLQQSKIELKQSRAALEAVKPKSPKKRLIDCLNSINPQILMALKDGTNKFQISPIPSKDFEELQQLALESPGNLYIKLGHVTTIMFGRGYLYGVNFELSPDLLK